jgi:NAD+ kinase
MSRVLLIAKKPLADRLCEADLVRLRAGGTLDEQRLNAAAEQHRQALAATRAAFARDDVVERTIETVNAADARTADLVVTVGGDGTVFTANKLDSSSPYLTVNSDPTNSIGHFTRANGATVAEVAERWRAGRATIEEVPRLRVSAGGRSWEILNDCLFSSENPAAMTKYLLEVDGLREQQRSSGVWVATAAGSTAAIHSAGADPVPAHLAALLFRVREPFQGQQRATIIAGTQLPPRGLRLTPATPGVALYIDGPNITIALAAGEQAEFTASPRPLRLIA